MPERPSGSTRRFETPFALGPGLREFLAGLWDGVRLRCPACSEGRIFADDGRAHPVCPSCEAPFERPGEGDFVGAIATSYAFLAAVIITLLLILNALTDWTWMVQTALASGISLALLVAFYRNMKGFWIAILVSMTKWMD